MKKKAYRYGKALFSNGKNKTSRIFVNPDAFSRWANAQYKKDNGVTIEEYEIPYNEGENSKFDLTYLKYMESKLVCTWHE